MFSFPTDLRVTALRSNRVNVSWSFAPPNGAPMPTGFRLEYRLPAAPDSSASAASGFQPASPTWLSSSVRSTLFAVQPEREYVFRVVATYWSRASSSPLLVNSLDSAPFVYSRHAMPVVQPATAPVPNPNPPAPAPQPLPASPRSLAGDVPTPGPSADSGAQKNPVSGTSKAPGDQSNEYYDEPDATHFNEAPSSLVQSPAPPRVASAANGARSPNASSTKEQPREKEQWAAMLSLYAGVPAIIALLLLILVVAALFVLFKQCKHRQGISKCIWYPHS